MVIHTFRYEELGILGPSVIALGQTDLFFAKWFAMRGSSTLLAR
jgi:hypothetical protein